MPAATAASPDGPQRNTTDAPSSAFPRMPDFAREVIRSPGQPLDAATRAFMEPRFGHAFDRVRIHLDDTAARSAAALRAAAFAAGPHIAFARGRFAPGTAAGKRLIAHELAHTIEHQAGPPRIALKKDPSSDASKLAGEVLDLDRNGRQILIAREVGNSQGYDGRWQAASVARLYKADPAAIARDKAGKWHAFETASGIVPEDASANDPLASKRPGRFTNVEVLASLAEVTQAQDHLRALQDKMKNIEDLQDKWTKEGRPDIVRQLRDEGAVTRRRINDATELRAARVFGVSAAEVQLNAGPADRVAGRINLTANPGPGANTKGRHGPVRGQEGDFHLGQTTAFDLDMDLVDDPESVQGTVFHETQHLKDFELAQLWVGRYQIETGRIFVGKGRGLEFFMGWINEQVRKKRLSAAEGQLVVDEAADATGTTEARANIRTFLLQFQSGHFDLATSALVAYARALPPGKVYANPPPGSPVLVEVTNELRAARKKAAKPAQAEFDKSLAAANAANPTTWFAKLNFTR